MAITAKKTGKKVEKPMVAEEVKSICLHVYFESNDPLLIKVKEFSKATGSPVSRIIKRALEQYSFKIST